MDNIDDHSLDLAPLQGHLGLWVIVLVPAWGLRVPDEDTSMSEPVGYDAVRWACVDDLTSQVLLARFFRCEFAIGESHTQRIFWVTLRGE
jgi:hypothetical protein